jgi:hypothetical protein
MTPFLPLEVLIYGVFWAYLIFLLPAAVVTALKRQWLILGIGPITLGLLWYIGAFGRGKEGCWWSRRFYANDPDSDSREFANVQNRRAARAAVVSAVVVLLIGLFAARPAPLLGISGSALQYDVGGILSFRDGCHKNEDGSWTCFLYDDAVSGDRPYRVTVDSLGCWDAEIPPEDRGGVRYTDPGDSGCLTIFSYLRPIDRILGG